MQRPATMKAVVTTGNGGYDRLVWRDVPVPEPGPGEVLLRVLAAGVNNTEINTRLGWYSSSVTTATNNAAAIEEERPTHKADGGWNVATPFPFIQGTDCCGRVVDAGPEVDRGLLGRRVLVRPCMRPQGFGSMDNVWMGSDFDGAFAEYVKVPAGEVFEVRCDWTDAELASIPCAYATAENMLHRARAAAGEHVLVTGASGGVGRRRDRRRIPAETRVDLGVVHARREHTQQHLAGPDRRDRHIAPRETVEAAVAGGDHGLHGRRLVLCRLLHRIVVSR